MRRFLFAILLALCATPALASIHEVTGSFTPTGSAPQFVTNGEYALVTDGPGTYQFTATFDQPVTGFFAPSYIEIFEIFDRTTHELIYGDCCTTTTLQIDFPDPTTAFQATFTYPGGSQFVSGPYLYLTSEVNFDVALWATGPVGTPISFDFTTQYLPEPAGWALMILGFGAVGAAMRRRNALAALT